MPIRVSRIVVPSLIVLAVIGFTAYLFKEPTRLLQMLLIYGLIFGIFFAVYRIFFRNKTNGSDRKYEQAVKQSKKRLKQKHKSRIKAPHLRVVGSNPHKLKKQKPSLTKKNEKHNFTVIEGRKSKKKNRALF
ncbi:SA1362 family protein [Pueribacillus sp. YX66]|uniref:SA1362 family protein n=1 Tax=Pueribacillus sp. YX66 TaxID=3229242 RepID=UPI00358D668D